MWSDRVPSEVLSDILTNPELSLEDVGRCSCVCKSWYSLITSPSFLSLHTKQRLDSITANKNNNNKSLFLVRTRERKPFSNNDEERFSLHLDDSHDDSFAEYKTSLDFPSSEPLHYATISYVRGVVCLSCALNTNIILWNPSIRKFLRLPQPPEVYVSDGIPMRYIGFGFDAATNDYKVVRVSHYWWRKKGGVQHHTEVFELSSGCWRSTTNPAMGIRGDHEMGNPVSIRGAVHWLATDMNDKKHKTIVSFDFRDEVFGMMSLPDCRGVRWSVHLLARGESLCLSYIEFSAEKRAICSLWVMKQYGLPDSWTKQCSIDLSPGIFTLQIVGFRKNDQVLVVNSLERSLSCYDPNKKRSKHLKQFPSRNFDVVNFTESLALLGVKLGMPGEAEDEVNSKGCTDVHLQKKMKIQS